MQPAVRAKHIKVETDKPPAAQVHVNSPMDFQLSSSEDVPVHAVRENDKVSVPSVHKFRCVESLLIDRSIVRQWWNLILESDFCSKA